MPQDYWLYSTLFSTLLFLGNFSTQEICESLKVDAVLFYHRSNQSHYMKIMQWAIINSAINKTYKSKILCLPFNLSKNWDLNYIWFKVVIKRARNSMWVCRVYRPSNTRGGLGMDLRGWSINQLVSFFDNIVNLEFYISSKNVICGSHVLMPWGVTGDCCCFHYDRLWHLYYAIWLWVWDNVMRRRED